MKKYCEMSREELLDLKKENVHLDEQYFDVICSKTENGIRKVPIPTPYAFLPTRFTQLPYFLL